MTPAERAREALSRCHDCDGWDADKLQKRVAVAIARAMIVAAQKERKLCEKACANVFGGKSHKVSENSERYRIQDETVDLCVKAIRNRK